MFSNYLAVTRIQGIFDELVDVRQYDTTLRWVNRIPSVPALDGEIMARYTGRIFMADIINNDQKAVTRAPNPIRFVQQNIPKIKHGMSLNEEYIKLLSRIEANLATVGDKNIFADYITGQVAALKSGVLARREYLLIAMLTDALTYDRLGIKISGLGWGMPSDLKVTPSNLWSDAANGKPINDIQAIKNTALYTYGIILNRVTMSQTALNYAVATAEVIAKAALFNQLVGVTTTNWPATDYALMRQKFSQFIGMEVEIDDRSTWTEEEDGTVTSVRYHPENKVLLTGTTYDGNRMVWDWASGEVLETNPGMVPSIIGGFDGPRRGPVGYVTASDPQGNPPGLNMWAVESGFPRKHKESVSAVLTVY